MGKVLEQAERFWQGEFGPGEHPFTSFSGFEELGTGLGFVSSFANVIAVTTSRGLVLFDTGSALAGKPAMAQIRAWSDAPVHSAVYTHGHLDHVMGILYWDEEQRERGREPITVIAHEAVRDRFDRYRMTAGLNQSINRRQFRIPMQWPSTYRYPDVTYRAALNLGVGDARFELLHAKGETDDATWAWLPEQRTVVAGDMFIWGTPNCGNPQKVQRYPRQWAKALREMAMRSAEIMLPGHGPPIVGAARVRQALTETAELLESLHDQTVAGMNAGATLDDLLHSVKPPAALLDRPYLRPIYDEPSFIVRNIWRLYGGWWDGNPSHLKPAPEAAVARELAALAGGPEKLAARAAELVDSDLPLAAHLAELAWRAAPETGEVRDRARKVRADVYRRRSEAETSLMARSIFRAAAEEK